MSHRDILWVGNNITWGKRSVGTFYAIGEFKLANYIPSSVLQQEHGVAC